MTEMMETFEGIVDVFPDGWVFVNVPERASRPCLEFAKIGNITITAYIGESEWNTLMWARGDGSFFVTIPAKVRKKEKIGVGSKVAIKFKLRVKEEYER